MEAIPGSRYLTAEVCILRDDNPTAGSLLFIQLLLLTLGFATGWVRTRLDHRIRMRHQCNSKVSYTLLSHNAPVPLGHSDDDKEREARSSRHGMYMYRNSFWCRDLFLETPKDRNPSRHQRLVYRILRYFEDYIRPDDFPCFPSVPNDLVP